MVNSKNRTNTRTVEQTLVNVSSQSVNVNCPPPTPAPRTRSPPRTRPRLGTRCALHARSSAPTTRVSKSIATIHLHGIFLPKILSPNRYGPGGKPPGATGKPVSRQAAPLGNPKRMARTDKGDLRQRENPKPVLRTRDGPMCDVTDNRVTSHLC